MIDLGLPDGDGTEFIRELRAAEPDVPVMVLTHSADPSDTRAVNTGSERVLMKDASVE